MIFRLGIAILQTSQEEILSMDMEGMLQVKSDKNSHSSMFVMPPSPYYIGLHLLVGL